MRDATWSLLRDPHPTPKTGHHGRLRNQRSLEEDARQKQINQLAIYLLFVIETRPEIDRYVFKLSENWPWLLVAVRVKDMAGNEKLTLRWNRLTFWLPFHQSACQSASRSVCLPAYVCLSVSSSVRPSTRSPSVSVFLSVRPSIHPIACLYIYCFQYLISLSPKTNVNIIHLLLYIRVCKAYIVYEISILTGGNYSQ